MSRSWDVLLNGPAEADLPTELALTEALPVIHREIARGSSLEDACLLAGIEPYDYAAHLDADPAARAAHERAERLRRAVLADAPLKLARELRAVREARGGLASLGDVVKAIHAEGALLKDSGAGRAGRAETTIRVVFDALPSIPEGTIEPLTESASVALSALSDGSASDYETLMGEEPEGVTET